MSNRRIARLNEQLKRELTELLREEVRDPRIGFATITGVSVTPDLAFARVHVTLGGDAAARASTLDGLRAAAPFLRGEIGKRMHIRRAPELRFLEDRSLEHAMRIEQLLREARPEPGDSAPDESGESGGQEEGVT